MFGTYCAHLFCVTIPTAHDGREGWLNDTEYQECYGTAQSPNERLYLRQVISAEGELQAAQSLTQAAANLHKVFPSL